MTTSSENALKRMVGTIDDVIVEDGLTRREAAQLKILLDAGADMRESATGPILAGGTRMARAALKRKQLAEDDPVIGASWAGVIAQEGVDTGDGRRIEAGALNWRELPLTMMSQLVTPEWGGHTDAMVAGRIDSITRDGENIVGSGVFDTGDHGAETERMVRDGMLKGVSVDLAVNEAEIIPDPDIEDEIEAWFMGTLNILDGTILGATVVPFPAFENASIAIVAGAAMRVQRARIEDRDGERTLVASFFMPFTPVVDGEALVASSSVLDAISEAEAALDKVRRSLS